MNRRFARIARLWPPDPVDTAALILACLAVLFFLLWKFADASSDWFPGLATEAIGIALTIAIVERIVERAARQRVQPRVDRAYADIEDALRLMAWAVAMEYANTHDESYERPPMRVRDVLEHWLNGREKAELYPKPSDSVLIALERLATELDKVRETNMDILEPTFIVETDTLARHLRQEAQLYSLFQGASQEGLPASSYMTMATSAIQRTHRYVVEFEELSGLTPTLDEAWALSPLETLREDEMRRRGRRSSGAG
jgi:hypothetical protein